MLTPVGIYKSIDEVFVQSKNLKRRNYLHLAGSKYAPELGHWVLRVVLKGGKSYAVDIAGAQFGYHQPVSPWESFYSERVQRIDEVRPFGHINKDDGWEDAGEPALVASYMNGYAGEHDLDRIIDGWLERMDSRLAAILKLKPAAYEAQSSEMLKVLDDGLAEFVQAGKGNALVVAIETKEGRFGEMHLIATFKKGDGSKEECHMMKG